MKKITRQVDLNIAINLVKNAKTVEKLNFYTDNVFPKELNDKLVELKVISEDSNAIRLSREEYHANKKFADKTKNSRYKAVPIFIKSANCFAGYRYFKSAYSFSKATILQNFKDRLENEQ